MAEDVLYEVEEGGFYLPEHAIESSSGALSCFEPDIPDWNTEEYSYQEENSWMSVKTSPFSTFAADVDTASYANLRRMILRGQEIPADAVRIEEMINYFSYDYAKPQGDEPFSVTTEIAPCPWNADTELLLIGLQAKKMEQEERPASNLVFLIDVSGSMGDPDKLPLVQRSIHLLAENLGPKDRISIVTYADGDEVVLEGVSGEKQAEISAAMEDLMAGGGTNGSAGIQTAYEIAEKFFIPGGNNRIILATDGDLNIGITDEGSLTHLIKEKAKSGVFLSVLGFGFGNLSDTNMEALADNGNGNYSYIDSVSEARKVLIDEMGATLFTVAKDVKLQVEFNPERIKGYRLIGYENRTMAAEDFSDDSKDGGEIGAGHRVTALYEIAKTDSAQ
ncbi:MAG: von Willebrand factor type A domain-containing protein, partial [Blautia sp.]|nr:von Willebrand factor type A domain-containing protein [Blautia sp.]